jgi:hypothetical protein
MPTSYTKCVSNSLRVRLESLKYKRGCPSQICRFLATYDINLVWDEYLKREDDYIIDIWTTLHDLVERGRAEARSAHARAYCDDAGQYLVVLMEDIVSSRLARAQGNHTSAEGGTAP